MIRYDRPRQALAVALATLAGIVDGIGFLMAGGYFVSFMSGNTTRLAVDLADDPSSATVPALLIGGFVAGVTAGTVIASHAGPRRKVRVLSSVAVLIALAALLHASGRIGIALGALVVAMGMLNTSFQRNGTISVGLTYMTGALVRCGQALGNAIAGRHDHGALAWLLLWLGLACGALAGSLAYLAWGGAALWMATAAALAAAFAAAMLGPASD